MSNPSGTDPELPSYEECNNNTVLGPAALHIAGRFIRSNDPNAPPLYELSHSIGFLRDTDRTVRFERLDHTVSNEGGRLSVSTRNRHIFNLKHPTAAEWPTFSYHAEPVSRRTLGAVGISGYRPNKLSTKKCYRINRAVKGADHRYSPREELFTAAPSRDRAVGYEWSDDQGNLVAREVETDELMSLVIGAEMESNVRDALVVSWIIRIWSELSKGNYRENTWDETKRILGIPSTDFPGLKGGMFTI